MKLKDWKEAVLKINNEEVQTVPVSYKQQQHSHFEYYELSKKYDKLLRKLMKLTDKDKITKYIENFYEESNTTMQLLSDKYHDAYLYIDGINKMNETLDEFKRKNI